MVREKTNIYRKQTFCGHHTCRTYRPLPFLATIKKIFYNIYDIVTQNIYDSLCVQYSTRLARIIRWDCVGRLYVYTISRWRRGVFHFDHSNIDTKKPRTAVYIYIYTCVNNKNRVFITLELPSIKWMTECATLVKINRPRRVQFISLYGITIFLFNQWLDEERPWSAGEFRELRYFFVTQDNKTLRTKII